MNQFNIKYLGQIQDEDKDKNGKVYYYTYPKCIIQLYLNGSLFTKARYDRKKIHQLRLRIIPNDSLHPDTIVIKVLTDNKSVLKNRSP